MNSLIINRGRVELHREDGTLARTIRNSDAFFADINTKNSLILVTTSNGRVELRTESGLLIRNIGDDNALIAKFSSENILVSTCKGIIEVRDMRGALIRLI